MESHSSMPQLGAGTFRLKDDVAYNSVKDALEVGYRHIDTAQIYENEEAVGRALKDSDISRGELFVTTKVWNNKLNSKDFLPSVKESLEKLQVSYVDLLLIHWPSPENGESMEEYLGELAKAKAQGLTRHIGVSNFTIAHLEEAQQILGKGEIFTNQVEVHPHLTNDKLRAYCTVNDIHITGYMPFAVGKVLKDETVIQIAEKYEVSPAEVVIAWELGHGLATIPSSTKRENLATNLKGASLTLAIEDMDAIDKLNRNEREATPDFSPEWD
ncbi:2,5-didehydrogluconate reductase DkgB [Alteromonas sp. RKMC-009]|uniref:2,5-didehydrogluconate reductase DkgB n=1 Tax=Alteromonas sp. RKMC-009 TaxID=2267264 RepID=UPI0026B2F862